MNADTKKNSRVLFMLVAAMLILLTTGICSAQDSGVGAAAEVESLERQAGSALNNDEVRSIVEAAVAKRIRPLVREIRRLEEQVWLHDILGGIGYIAGLAGLAFYFLGVRRKEKLKGEGR